MTKTWGRYGTGPGEFNLPHSIAVDREGHVYVAGRENQRIQIFDADGTFLKEWTDIGYPYGLFITPDQNVWMIDGGYDRIVEIDQGGRIMGAFGEPGHAPRTVCVGTLSGNREGSNDLRRRCTELAISSPRTYAAKWQSSTLRSVEEDALGPRREHGVVDENGCSKGPNAS
jgi:hypothetical protein